MKERIPSDRRVSDEPFPLSHEASALLEPVAWVFGELVH